MPSGSATQFRYTQTPSKVLHLRNMPWECTEEELVELCKPFGRIVNTKSGVGANRNQAFVEFVSPSPAPLRPFLSTLPVGLHRDPVGNSGRARRSCNVLHVREIDAMSSFIIGESLDLARFNLCDIGILRAA